MSVRILAEEVEDIDVTNMDFPEVIGKWEKSFGQLYRPRYSNVPIFIDIDIFGNAYSVTIEGAGTIFFPQDVPAAQVDPDELYGNIAECYNNFKQFCERFATVLQELARAAISISGIQLENESGNVFADLSLAIDGISDRVGLVRVTIFDGERDESIAVERFSLNIPGLKLVKQISKLIISAVEDTEG